ncbi:MAG: hypothetical protein ABIR79_21460 [Candidatus Binatia bacterium]
MSKIYDALQHLEAQRKAMDTGPHPEPSFNPLDLQERPASPAPTPVGAAPRVSAQPLLEQAAAVTRFDAELHRRMGEAGLDGVQGLFALADQLQRALAVVSTPELDTAETDLERVANQVRSMQDSVRQLKAVKTDLEGLTGLGKI